PHPFHLGEGVDVTRGILGQPVDEPLREDDSGVELPALGRVHPALPQRPAAPGTAAPASTAARIASPARRTTWPVQPLTVRMAAASRGLSTASATSTSFPMIMKGGRSRFTASLSRILAGP